MDDNRKHQDTDFSEDDMRLLYALGEARIAADGAAARPQYGHWRRLPPWR